MSSSILFKRSVVTSSNYSAKKHGYYTFTIIKPPFIFVMDVYKANLFEKYAPENIFLSFTSCIMK